MNDRLPMALGATILTNDLIWWVPFTLILWKAAQANQAEYHLLTVTPPSHSIDPMGRVMSQMGATISELSRRKPLLVVFLRHSGCTFCREALSDIAAQRRRSNSEERRSRWCTWATKSQRNCWRRTACPICTASGIRCALSTKRSVCRWGGFRQLFGLKVWWRGFQAFLAGHGIGGLNGNGFRMPGTFLIKAAESCVRIATLPRPTVPTMSNWPRRRKRQQKLTRRTQRPAKNAPKTASGTGCPEHLLPTPVC